MEQQATEGQADDIQPHNPILLKLVVEEDDLSLSLIGRLAYAEYKIQKFEFFRDTEVNEGRSPTHEELKGFLRNYNDRRLDQLRSEAEQTLFEFADEISQQFLTEQTRNSAVLQQVVASNAKVQGELDDVKTHITDRTKAKVGFFLGIGSSIAATIFLAVLLAIIGASSSDSNFGKLYRAIVLNEGKLTLEPSPKNDLN
ncbi:hypothetical protein [Marinobacterium sedimentorum]|uniref:hypothetical protein n=1 Tax=Marinobacterium sedimentorum TaxID=2927804 RepID=UPI0020C66298|nr:hypothetical protein [Marinobacterium sedimentorum]MCP8689433.1 hypothetical protein [Marinobacterium sedimentorum]